MFVHFPVQFVWSEILAKNCEDQLAKTLLPLSFIFNFFFIEMLNRNVSYNFIINLLFVKTKFRILFGQKVNVKNGRKGKKEIIYGQIEEVNSEF